MTSSIIRVLVVCLVSAVLGDSTPEDYPYDNKPLTWNVALPKWFMFVVAIAIFTVAGFMVKKLIDMDHDRSKCSL
jgi:ABC-type Fe3+-siderophore transport system permease subunit